MFFIRSPPLVQQVGNHAHEGFGFDLAPLLQLIQVQSEFKPLGSTQKTSTLSREQPFFRDATATARGLKHSHCLDVGGQSGQADVQPLSHGEDLLKICGDHLGLDAESPICRYGHAVLPPHGHHGPSVVGHNRLKDGKETKDSPGQPMSMHFILKMLFSVLFKNMPMHWHKIR